MEKVQNNALHDIIKSATKNHFRGNESKENNEIAKTYTDVIEQLMTEKDIDQKSFLYFDQIAGIIELGAYNKTNEVTFGVRDDVADFIIIDTMIKMINEGGWGRLSIVAMFQNLKEAVDGQFRANMALYNQPNVKRIT